MKTYIFSGGTYQESFVKKILEQDEELFCLIAVDKGLESCLHLGLTPHYIVGDFDSVSPEMSSYLKQNQDRVWQLNPIKDDTDTEAAVRLALEKTEGDIVIFGGTGTRLDHVLGNIAVLGLGLKKNRNICLLDEKNRIRLVQKELYIKKEEQFGTYISVLPMGEKAVGVTLEGMAYPLKNHTLEKYSSLGISNEILEDTARIFTGRGDLIVMETRD